MSTRYKRQFRCISSKVVHRCSVSKRKKDTELETLYEEAKNEETESEDEQHDGPFTPKADSRCKKCLKDKKAECAECAKSLCSACNEKMGGALCFGHHRDSCDVLICGKCIERGDHCCTHCEEIQCSKCKGHHFREIHQFKSKRLNGTVAVTLSGRYRSGSIHARLT